MSIKCPKCGQPIKEEKDKEYVECFICKTRVDLPKTETPQQTATAKPIHQPIYAQPVQQPQKPNHGFCVQCHSTNLTFNDDGSGKCNNCGRVFNWKQQQQYWQQQMYMPRCFRCGSPHLQYFPNGRGICNYCNQIFNWQYDFYGRIIMTIPDFT